MLKENIRPDIMICGHKHIFAIDELGGINDGLGQPCTVVVGSMMDRNTRYYGGSGYIFDEGKIQIVFNDSEKTIKTHMLSQCKENCS